VVFVHKAAAANSLIIATTGAELVGGQATLTLTDLNELARLQSDGTGWIIITVQNQTAEDEAVLPSNTSDEAWIFREVQPNATNGGTNVADAWTTRTLNNTLSDYGVDVKRTGNDIVMQQGRYHVHAESTFYRTDNTRLRLRNVTDNLTEEVSLSAYAHTGSTIVVALSGVVTVLSAEKTFRLEYFCSKSQRSDGLGVASGSGDSEVFTTVRITRDD